MAKKEFIKETPHKHKVLAFSYNTSNLDWHKKVFDIIDNYKLKRKLKTEIKMNLEKNFFKFLRGTNLNRDLSLYSDWLSDKYTLGNKLKINHMCQTKHEKNRKNPYKIIGSGNPTSFCVEGTKQRIENPIGKRQEKYFSDFTVKITIFKE